MQEYTGDVPIMVDDVEDLPGCMHCMIEGQILSGLDQAKEQASILLRHEALRDCGVEIDGSNRKQQRGDERRPLMAEYEAKATVIGAHYRLKAALGGPVEPALVLLVCRFQKQRASTGVRVSEKKAEANTAIETVAANS